ncbi:MAG TPA: thermonuclease family protein [candidate division Zixibacteria bacterium]|nr:thermonuclease family protein [candidate division Zixibacteria bacterium]
MPTDRAARNPVAAVVVVAAISLVLSACGTNTAGAAGHTAVPTASATARFTASPRATPRDAPTEPATTAPTSSPERQGLPTSTPEPVLGSAPIGPTQAAFVERVIDGDTIEVRLGGQSFTVRYIGIDTPETVHPSRPVEWMGPEASAANSALVLGREVVLEKDVSETDDFGRLLRYVWLPQDGGWLLVNRELVRRGFATSSTYPPDVRYQELFLAAEREARAAGAGLWGATPPPATEAPPAGGTCDPSYPDVCIPPPPPDLDCGDVPFRRFRVVPPDPHRFDGNHDGVGCES